MENKKGMTLGCCCLNFCLLSLPSFIWTFTIAKEVWIPGLNLHRFWRFYSFVFSAFNNQFEKLHVYQILERVFYQVSSTSKWVKKRLGCASLFQPTSFCLDILMKQSSRVWYITSTCSFCNEIEWEANHLMRISTSCCERNLFTSPRTSWSRVSM